MMKKKFDRKWVMIAVAAYLLIMVDLLPSLTIASLIPAPQLPVVLGGSEGGKTGSPRKALVGRFKFKGAISLDSHLDFEKNKKRRAVELRSLRVISTGSPPPPLHNRRTSYKFLGPPPPLLI